MAENIALAYLMIGLWFSVPLSLFLMVHVRLRMARLCVRELVIAGIISFVATVLMWPFYFLMAIIVSLLGLQE